MFTVDTMLAQKGGPVTISSVLINMKELKPETIDAIRNATIVSAVQKAVDLWGPKQDLTIRDLNADDMSYTNNIFTETSNGTPNAWNTMAFGAFSVPNSTVLGIYGVKPGYTFDGTVKTLPITGIRVDVGGSRVAQWNLQTLDQKSSAANTSPSTAIGGVTKSPIIVAEDITVTFYEYTRTESTAYDPCWLGVAVEKQGLLLKP